MTVVAVICIVLPLLRRRPGDGALGISETNLTILRDQQDELRRDLGSGTISRVQYASARVELERRALEEASAGTRGIGAEQRGGPGLAVALGLLIPVAALSMYLWIGEPAGLRSEAKSAGEPVSPVEVEAMVAQLATRMEKNPDDPRGWVLLARSYYVMQRMPEAAAAYAKAAERITDDPDLYADYADALAMSQGRNLAGKPMELVSRALKINPSQPKALAMAGTEAFDRKDYPAAIAYWERLLPMLPPGSEMSKSIVEGIAEARELGGTKALPKSAGTAKADSKPGQKSTAPGSVTGRVTLSPGLAAKADPQDTLFIVARAVDGPRIPLAVLRRRVVDLPADFTLDDTQAMSPELKLSGFSDVVLTARVSKSGNAISRSGDLQGMSMPVKVGARGVAIVIDSVVP